MVPPQPRATALPVLCRFLSLAGNRIRRVENLQLLRHLRVLDLSHNQIQTLDPGREQEQVRCGLGVPERSLRYWRNAGRPLVWALPGLLAPRSQLEPQQSHSGAGLPVPA